MMIDSYPAHALAHSAAEREANETGEIRYVVFRMQLRAFIVSKKWAFGSTAVEPRRS